MLLGSDKCSEFPELARPGRLQIQFSLFIKVFSDSIPRILLPASRCCMIVMASCLLFWQNGWKLRAQHKANPENTSVAGG